ncbi:hypothetical protein EUW85_23175, partial [Salmonella enterica subsp. enterica serovar Ngili]|nr:hypothetical protein [Salmonella enterica subsp. enterica serovar Ngili]
ADTLRFAREVSQRQAAVNNDNPMQEGIRSADAQRIPGDVVPLDGKPVDISVCQEGEDCVLINMDSARPMDITPAPVRKVRAEIFDVVPEDKVVPLNER